MDEEIPDDSVDGDRDAVRALFTNHKGNVAKSLRLALGTVFFDTPFVSVYILPSQKAKRRLTYLSNELNNHIESPRSISERGLDLLVLI